MFKLHGGDVRAEFGHFIVFELLFRYVFFVVRIKCMHELSCGHVSIQHRTIVLHKLPIRQLLPDNGTVSCDGILFFWLLFSGCRK